MFTDRKREKVGSLGARWSQGLGQRELVPALESTESDGVGRPEASEPLRGLAPAVTGVKQIIVIERTARCSSSRSPPDDLDRLCAFYSY